MSKISAYALLLFSAAILSSCEGNRAQHGIIRDKQTGFPLNHVLIEANNYHEKEEIYTDSIGRFTVDGAFGGCMPDCPDIVIRLSKKGYQSMKVKNPPDTVFYLAPRIK